MADSANRFVLSGAGIDGSVVLNGLAGEPVIDVTVDGRSVRAPAIEHQRRGLVVSAIHEEVPDSHTVIVEIVIPEANLGDEPVVCAGYAELTTSRTSLGGPALVTGPLQSYDLRPLAVHASIVDS